MKPAIVLFATLLSLLPLTACGPEVDHYHRALAVERELLRRSPDADYGDPRYVQVMQELDAVPLRSKDHHAAGALFDRIRDGRRVGLEKSHRGAGRLPSRLMASEAPRPQRPPRAQPPSVESHAARSTTPARAPNAPTLTEEQRSRLAITLYSTTWCGYCKRARSWFQQMGYPFVEKDIEKDAAAAAEYAGKSGGYGGVPLIDVNGTVIRGYDRPSLERAIQKALGT